MNTTIVSQLAAFTADARASALPDAVVASVRQRLLDILGLTVAATRLPTSDAVIRMLLARGGAEQASIVGQPSKVPTSAAAFANGVLAHSLDYDDTHLPSVLHPSASVIPAALAVAEATGASGDDLVTGIACGIEIVVRVGMAGYDEAQRQSTFFEHGQHATSICGALGSAAAAAKILGLDADGIAHAMAIAASMGSGIIEANRTGGTVKRIHCGLAAQAGVTAAELAQNGITGPPTVFEGRFGFFQAWLHGQANLEVITKDLGREWSVPVIFFKPYPANHFTHAGIDAAIALRRRGIRPADIRSLHLGVAGATVRTIGEPLASKRAPETGYQAQFSGPYTVAAALLGGGGLGLALSDFTDDLARDPERRALMAKITVGANDECDAIYPYQFPAVLTAELVDGSQVVERVLANRGGVDRPLSDEELATKFASNVQGLLDEEAAEAVPELCRQVELLDSVEPLTRILRTV